MHLRPWRTRLDYHSTSSSIDLPSLAMPDVPQWKFDHNYEQRREPSWYRLFLQLLTEAPNNYHHTHADIDLPSLAVPDVSQWKFDHGHKQRWESSWYRLLLHLLA
ncbi:hypothetical protein D9611_010152 [Ephemerocybe angulata]|uniref:Uncharacterized protein n=1 Tax=Ephemerocybe angulata TaxID=980116 RepID=A0A8H5EVA0_9AGAR|nr:hypothetical protein D9611_010152 [Tulosesus angulatus]